MDSVMNFLYSRKEWFILSLYVFPFIRSAELMSQRVLRGVF